MATWNRRDYIEIGVLLGVIALMHVVGFAVLVFAIAPHHYRAGTQIFGVGLGVTAYLFGLRHAFDADHIAAIDNTTRKLMSDGKKPKAVGFWFAMGHSTLVLVMAVLIMVGARVVGTLADEKSPTRHVLGIAGTLASGLFLYLIAIINVIAMVGIYRAFARLRHGSYSDSEIEAALNDRGFFARLLRPIMNRISGRSSCIRWARSSAWDSTPPPRWHCWRWPAPARRPAFRGTPSWWCRFCSRPA